MKTEVDLYDNHFHVVCLRCAISPIGSFLHETARFTARADLLTPQFVHSREVANKFSCAHRRLPTPAI